MTVGERGLGIVLCRRRGEYVCRTHSEGQGSSFSAGAFGSQRRYDLLEEFVVQIIRRPSWDLLR